jgi:UDP-2-acetamido-2-deoxy-ribo-hexuluronate aminotransferase
MNFFDLAEQNKLLNFKIKKKIDKIFNHNKYILGPEIYELEKKLSKFTGSKYVVTCSSGTDAILMSLMAIGVKSGDEVITTAFTWMSNAEMIKLLGAKPVFIDVCSNTFNIDPEEIEKKITKKTKAILAVSLFGQAANFKEINKIAKKRNVIVIEDAAQSFGATHYDKYSCNLTDIAITSFFPTKPLGGYGDGGACFTKNKKIFDKLKMIRNHGQKKKGTNLILGLNGRLDTIQAAIILCKLDIFYKELKLRNKIAYIYDNEFKDCSFIKTPFIEKYNNSVYAQYSILCEDRKKIIKNLKSEKIPFFIFYDKPVYKQKPYRVSNLKLKNTDLLSKKILSIPFHPYLKFKSQRKIIDAIKKV